MFLLRYSVIVMLFYWFCYFMLCYFVGGTSYINVASFFFYFVFLWHYRPWWTVAASFEVSEQKIFYGVVLSPCPTPQPGGLKNIVCM